MKLTLTNIVYLIYAGVAAGLAFGVGKIVGSILSEIGKDLYAKIKRSMIKRLESERSGVIIEICIQVHEERYITFFNPSASSRDELERDIDNAYKYLEQNKDRLLDFNCELVDLERLRCSKLEDKSLPDHVDGRD